MENLEKPEEKAMSLICFAVFASPSKGFDLCAPVKGFSAIQ